MKTPRTGLVRLALVILVLATAACDSGDSAPVEIAPAQAVAQADLPDAEGPIVLRVTGRADAALDLAALTMLRRLQVTVFEPFEERTRSFVVVDVGDLLTLLGVEGDVLLRAVDDYEISFTAAEVSSGGLLLAIGDEDGQTIPPAKGGPLRIVLPKGGPVDNDLERWIWSVTELEVG